MAWIMALIWAACCAGAAAAAMKEWVQPEREVSRRRWTAILVAAALGGVAAGWFTGNAGMILSYEVRCLAALALVGAGAVVDLHLRRIPNLCSLLLLAVLAYTCTKSEPWGYICGGVGLVAGMLKYRALVQYNSETVKRFKNTYKDEMDVKKFNKFVETHF